MRRPANHGHVCRKRGEAMPRPYEQSPQIVGATHASPCKPPPWASRQGEAMARPYEQSPQTRRGDACGPLQNHSHVCRKRARQCLAPTNNHLKFVEGDACVALRPPPWASKQGEAMPRPYEQSPQIRRGDACVALRPPPWASKEGEAMPRPYEQSPQIRRGDACVALQTTATYVERGRGNASPLRTITSNS